MNKKTGTDSNFWRKHRIELIMWVLIGEMLASPFADYHRHVGALLGLIVLCTLIVGVRTAGNMDVIRFAVLPAAGVWMIARGFEAFGDGQHFYTQLAPVAGLALSCSILWAIFHHFNSVPESSSQRDCGSVHRLPGDRHGIFSGLLDP